MKRKRLPPVGDTRESFREWLSCYYGCRPVGANEIEELKRKVAEGKDAERQLESARAYDLLSATAERIWSALRSEMVDHVILQ